MNTNNPVNSKKDDVIYNNSGFWFPFLIIAGLGHVWNFFNLSSGKVVLGDSPLYYHIVLALIFLIGIFGTAKTIMNPMMSFIKSKFYKWYIPLIVVSILGMCFVNLTWLFN